MKARSVSHELMQTYFDVQDGELIWKRSNSNRVKIGEKAGTLNGHNRYVVQVNGQRYYRARIIFAIMTGDLGGFDIVDHINHDTTDDRIENLRVVTTKLNNAYRGLRKDNTSGYKGVYKTATGRWTASINKQTQAYTFSEIEDAATVYNFWAAEHHGEYANYNTVEQPWLESM